MTITAPPFAARIIAWQVRHGRHDLPWQGTHDAYRIWLAEVMLQQTQVATVIPYYRRFIERFATTAELAAAPLDAVLGLWSGLGYYSRARNLHRCARAVVAEHDGSFPASVDALALLPGIGRSTAAAIAALAYGRRAAILDGNVKRVLCRHFSVTGHPGVAAVERELWQLAESLLPEDGIAAYTQGLMDLGATLCTRTRPDCQRCPLAATCSAHRQGTQQSLPTPRPRRQVPERATQVLLLVDAAGVWLEQRPPTGIWGGLLAPPEMAVGEPLAAALLRLGCAAGEQGALPPLRHAFTHFRLTLHPLVVRVTPLPGTAAAPTLQRVAWPALADAALPAPIRRLLIGLAPALT